MNEITEKISRARLQLMLRNPYLAGAVARLPMREAIDMPWCQTMATDGYNIFWNTEFCASLKEDELSGVIAHELLHCILGHNDRRNGRDRHKWNVAIDHATNLFLLACEIHLPKDRLADWRYKGLTAEQIYDRLPKQSEPFSYKAGGGNDQRDGSFNVSPMDKAQANGGFDIHLEELDLEGAAERSKAMPTAIEKMRIRRELTKEVKSKWRGVFPAHFEEEFNKAGESKTPWQAIMAQFMSGIRKDDYRTYPYNRKHIWRGLYLPSIGRPGPSHIAIAVDTSGSMNRELLGKVLAELDALRTMTECKLTLIECDAEIQNVTEYEGWEIADLDFDTRPFRGRGGTVFDPVFDWMKNVGSLQNPPPEALIFLTDGEAPFPNIRPMYYVLWVFPKDFQRKAPFGISLNAL
jgi:predicted metal-dependent peptidase